MDALPKLSSSRTIGFRPGEKLRGLLDALSARTRRPHSDIIRDGLLGNWPQIESLNLALAGSGPGEDADLLLSWLSACREAHRLGLNPRETLLAAATAKHETQPANGPANGQFYPSPNAA